MTRYDAVVVGGGPAGSTCARRLVSAGCRVAVLDKAEFPRDKVCTGWITPSVVRTLELDLADYATARTLQPFTGFRTAPIDGPPLLSNFGHTISYGIRRREFDEYLLRRSGADLVLGQPLRTLRREGDAWVANDAIRAPLVVGAGGHFCPIARRMNPAADRDGVVVAQEAEYPIDSAKGEACSVSPEQPELFFWPDFMGYGWCVRKGRYLNVGAGHLSRVAFPARARRFSAMLQTRGLVTAEAVPWKGHAYLLNRTSTRRVADAGLLLAGDAAGLALAPSGEGILAAVESGLMAADAVLEARETYSGARLAAYAERIEDRFGPRGKPHAFARLPSWLTSLASRAVLSSPRLTRRFLIEQAFLHVGRAPYVQRASVPVTS